MTRQQKANQSEYPVVADDLAPHLKGRVKGLIQDLGKDDLPMALLDLAQLYRALSAGGIPLTTVSEVRCEPEAQQTLILGEDGAAVEDDCMGPDAQGKCPRATEGAACAGKWIMNRGWTFRVAPDAGVCPLVSMGLAHRYLRAAVSGAREEVHPEHVLRDRSSGSVCGSIQSTRCRASR